MRVISLLCIDIFVPQVDICTTVCLYFFALLRLICTTLIKTGENSKKSPETRPFQGFITTSHLASCEAILLCHILVARSHSFKIYKINWFKKANGYLITINTAYCNTSTSYNYRSKRSNFTWLNKR